LDFLVWKIVLEIFMDVSKADATAFWEIFMGVDPLSEWNTNVADITVTLINQLNEAKEGTNKIRWVDLHWREGRETYPIADYTPKSIYCAETRRYILDRAYYDTKYNLEWDLIISVNFVDSYEIYFPRKELDSFFRQKYPNFFLVWSNNRVVRIYRIIARYFD
jgi:hypothetical protein